MKFIKQWYQSSVNTENEYQVQWNPSIMDTILDQNFVPYSEMSLTQELLVYIQYRRGKRNQAVQHNMAAFSERTWIYRCREPAYQHFTH